MMRIGIVGSESAKFSKRAERRAKAVILALLNDPAVRTVVSGKCHLGGIDIWAAEIGRELGLEVVEYPPKIRSWEGGYKQRNLQIARDSDVVCCITVDRLPDTYAGMKFSRCYHCGTDEHVKSGGCWTVKQAVRMGKYGEVLVVAQ